MKPRPLATVARSAALGLTALAVSSCGTQTAPSSPPPSVPKADRPAQEVGCPYTEPVDAARAPYKVTLAFRVTERGEVDPASIDVVPNHHDTTDRTFVDRARSIVRDCTYRPALEDGLPVQMTVRKRFYFDPSA